MEGKKHNRIQEIKAKKNMKDFIEMQNHLKTLSVWKCDAGTERNLKKSSGKEKRGMDETYKFWSRLSSG